MATPKLRFKEFDGNWNTVNLKHCIESIDSGWSPQCESYSANSAQWGVLKTTSVDWDGFKENANKKLPETLEPRPEIEVKPYDILVTRAGPTERVGVVSVVPNNVRGKLLISDKLIRIKSNQDNDPNFLGISLSSSKCQNQLQSKTSGLAKSQTNISQKILLDVALQTPCREEQTKIASFLSAVDEKISQLTQKHELLSQYKQGMMQKLFSQQIRFKADDGSEFGEWENKPLSELSEKAMYGMNASATEYDGINKYLRISDICEISHKLKKDSLTSPNAELEEKYKLGYGDLLFARTGASVGKSYLYSLDDGIAYFAGFLIKFSLKLDLVNPYFVFAQTLTLDFDKWVVTNSMRSGQPGINAEEYSSYIFKVPCLEEQTKIANFLSAIDQKIEVVAQQIEQAKTWKKGLLQQMFV